MNDRRMIFDMQGGPKRLQVSQDALDMTEMALERAEAERKRMAFKQMEDDEIAKRISPPGALGLPELLERRRHELKLTDAMFEQVAMFDKVLLYQFPKGDGETIPGSASGLILSEKGKARTEQEAPRGIIVSAGLQALDELETNGSGIGHIVLFVRLSPWRVPFETVMGKDRYLIPLRTCDIIADEDAGRQLRDGQLVRARTPQGRNGFHGIVPLVPEMQEDGV